MNKLKFILCTLLFTSCIIQKEVHISIRDSSDVSVDSTIKGSDLKDISPELELPFP